MKRLGLIAFAAAVLLSVPVLAAVDFSGKRIEIIVPYEAGGGTDLYVRFIAPLLSEKLPGKPTIIVTNVPGAGAIAGGNQFQQRAKPDGLTLIGIGTSLTANFAMRDARVKYKLDEWIPIIGSPSGTVVYGHSSLGLKGPDDIALLKDKKLIMGANNPTGGDMRVLLSLDGLGFDVQGVFGLNRGDVRPAFERGEFNINFDTTAAYQVQTVPLVQAGTAVPLFTLGMWEPGDKIVRDPLVPDVPTYAEVYRKLHGKDPEGDAYKAWLAVYKLNFLLALGLDLPTGTPREIVDTYHQAIKEVVAEFGNPKYAEQARKIVGPYKQVIGEDAERSLQESADFPDGAYEWLQTWLKTKFDQGK
jgi:tripartite-type tricarboxylate transporter receptor subunit TctC